MKVNTGCSFIHPVTRQMIHPGQTYEDHADAEVKPASVVVSADVSMKTVDDFCALSADDQKHELVRLNLISSVDDESASNKEKRLALYSGYLEGMVGDREGNEAASPPAE